MKTVSIVKDIKDALKSAADLMRGVHTDLFWLCWHPSYIHYFLSFWSQKNPHRSGWAPSVVLFKAQSNDARSYIAHLGVFFSVLPVRTSPDAVFVAPISVSSLCVSPPLDFPSHASFQHLCARGGSYSGEGRQLGPNKVEKHNSVC